MPDANIETTTQMMGDSAFGCAGQRCLAVSVAVTVGEARDPFTEGIADLAASRKVGYGLDESTEMGPVITRESRQRIEGLIENGAQEGARVLVDGRQKKVAGYDDWLLGVSDGAGLGGADKPDRAYGDLRPGSQPDARGYD